MLYDNLASFFVIKLLYQIIYVGKDTNKFDDFVNFVSKLLKAVSKKSFWSSFQQNLCRRAKGPVPTPAMHEILKVGSRGRLSA